MSEFDLSQELPMDESLILEYLQDNPDFFLRNASLVQHLRLPHQQKGVVSLVELQAQRLREKIANLENEITDLMSVASHNEKIFHVYVDLLPDLLACNSFAELQHRLCQALEGELGLSKVSLCLNRDALSLNGVADEFVMSAEQIERIRLTRLSHDEHYFGRLTQGEVANLFGDENATVGSVALMPLGHNGQFGLFVAASQEPDHYVAGMDSLLLTQLCQIVTSMLLRLLTPVNS